MIYQALDHRFTIRGDPAFVAIVGEALSRLEVQTFEARDISDIDVSQHSENEWVIESDGFLLRAATPGAALARVLEHINQRAAASLTTSVPLHAAAVEHRRGGIVALAGASGSGKSTLCAAAVLDDWGFLSDEVTAVDPTSMTVRGYHRPIGLRPGGAAAIGVPLPIDDDGFFSDVYPWPTPTARVVDSGPLLGIAVMARSVGPSRHESLRPAEALAALVEHVVVPDDNRVIEAFRGLEVLARHLPVVRLEFNGPLDGIALLDELVEQWER